MSRMSEMCQASQDYCNENYGPEDAEVDRIMSMSEDELRAKDGETIESAAARSRAAFERAKIEVDVRKALQAWLKCPAEKRPSPEALGQLVASIVAKFPI